MKICDTCKIEKNFLEFNKNKTKRDGLNSICRECSNKRSKLYYKNNREKHVKTICARNKLLISKIKKCANKIKSEGCQNCGEKDICCIEFHHLDKETKINHVSKLLRRASLYKVKLEMSKCSLLCANCHKRLHYRGLDIELKPIHIDLIEKAFEDFKRVRKINGPFV